MTQNGVVFAFGVNPQKMKSLPARLIEKKNHFRNREYVSTHVVDVLAGASSIWRQSALTHLCSVSIDLPSA